jgi:polyferredoxin
MGQGRHPSFCANNEGWPFKNTYSPTLLVILIAVLLLILAFRIRRSFCEMLCPVGTLSNLILKFESLSFKNEARKDTAAQKKP